jgi:DnaK suppressor protein
VTKTPAKTASKVATTKAPAKVSAATTAKTTTGKIASKSKDTPPSAALEPAALVPKTSPPATKVAKTATKVAQASAKPAESAVPESKVSQNMTTAATTKVDSKLANAWKTKPGSQLSDAELLAMPDSEYMSDKQQEFFRTKLEALKDDLLSNAGETTEHLREDTSIVPDPADRATIEEEHALELRTRDRERKLLKKISQALTRLESGDYGFCDETGEPIGLGRLLARPTATLSIEAQQRRELKQKMFGD